MTKSVRFLNFPEITEKNTETWKKKRYESKITPDCPKLWYSAQQINENHFPAPHGFEHTVHEL